MNAAEHALVRDGRTVPLAPKVFDVLLVLLENAGHVVSKDLLMEAVWPDTFVEEGNLATAVYTLRKTFGEDSQFIETVPKRGYRFVGDAREIPEDDSSVPDAATLVPAVEAAEAPTPPSEADAGAAPAGLDRVVRHCLEKRPDERFQSARDLAFAIDELSAPTGASVAASAVPRSRRALPTALVVALAVVVAGDAGLLVAARAGWITIGRPASRAAFHQVTFRRGAVQTARFSSDGQSIAFSAAWYDRPGQSFVTRTDTRETHQLDLAPNTEVLAISSLGELAVTSQSLHGSWGTASGTLARVSMAGGAPRDVLEDVGDADWAPDSQSLAVVHFVGDASRIEFPIGHVLFESPHFLSDLRVSPKGDRLAFIDHSSQWNSNGTATVVDLAGNATALSGPWDYTQGLAWAPSGDEVWFAASTAGVGFKIVAVTLEGRQRDVAQLPGNVNLFDISGTGRVLLSQGSSSWGIVCLAPGESKERDISWSDSCIVQGISADGSKIHFVSAGEATGRTRAEYVGGTDGSPPVRIAERSTLSPGGDATTMSPDGRFMLFTPDPQLQLDLPTDQIAIVPTGAGRGRSLPRGPIATFQGAVWFPDGRRIAIVAAESGRQPRVWVQDVDGGDPQPLTPEGTVWAGPCISPDGKLMTVFDSQSNNVALYPVEGGGAPALLRGYEPEDGLLAWSADGRSLYAVHAKEVDVVARASIYRIDVATGQRTLWKEIEPADPTGIVVIGTMCVTPDGRSYAYTCSRTLSQLYWVEGMH